jgi:glyoxylase-like metal-dependent hydrolase (beta-lactamase superfamily II)
MSIDAANMFAPGTLHLCDEYDEAAYYADEIVTAGDVIKLGGVSVEVMKTAGHTRDSISFYIPELRLLIANETLGIPGKGDSIFPSYLVSLTDTLDAISRCKAVEYKYLSVPHKGLIADDLAEGYFERSEKSMYEFRDLILTLYDRGADEEEILKAYAEKFNYPRPPDVIKVNDYLTMMCTLRDCGRV